DRIGVERRRDAPRLPPTTAALRDVLRREAHSSRVRKSGWRLKRHRIAVEGASDRRELPPDVRLPLVDWRHLLIDAARRGRWGPRGSTDHHATCNRYSAC